MWNDFKESHIVNGKEIEAVLCMKTRTVDGISTPPLSKNKKKILQRKTREVDTITSVSFLGLNVFYWEERSVCVST